jgi:tRNA A58 N-methylase Trm61
MADGEQAAGEVRKLSRLEREQEKIRIAQKNIDEILADNKEKQRKQDTRDKVLLGVMLQGMIVDGAISTELFEKALEKYLKNDKDRDRCDTYFELHRPKGKKV